MKKLAFIFLLGLAFTACEAEPIDDATFGTTENDTKPEIIDILNDTNHGSEG